MHVERTSISKVYVGYLERDSDSDSEVTRDTCSDT